MKVWLVYGQYFENGVVAVCATEDLANREAVRIITAADPGGPQALPDDDSNWGGLAFVREAEVIEEGE